MGRERRRPRAGAPAAVASAAPAPRGPAACTVLLVEDDALVSMATREMLKALGHRVIEASSGDAALEILRAGASVDLVVSDEAMPGMRGTELAAAIRAAWPALPIMLATGYAELPKDSEPDLLLRKPYAQEDLRGRDRPAGRRQGASVADGRAAARCCRPPRSRCRRPCGACGGCRCGRSPKPG